MNEDTTYTLSAEGHATVEAVDGYLAEAIGDDRPIEALIATRRLGEIVDARAKEAARAATAGSSSWADVGQALGVTKQAAHEKLRVRIHDKLDHQRAKLERAEKARHAKIARRAQRGRDQLDHVPLPSPAVDAARQRLSEWERSKHDRLHRDVQKAHEEFDRAEKTVEDALNQSSSANRS